MGAKIGLWWATENLSPNKKGQCYKIFSLLFIKLGVIKNVRSHELMMAVRNSNRRTSRNKISNRI